MKDAFSRTIKAIREKNKWNQKELADLLGVSASTVSMYENSIRKPNYRGLERIADRLHMSIQELTGEKIKKQVRVLGNVPAGIPIEAIEEDVDMEEIGGALARDGFEYIGLRVKGDSMFPEYRSGDTLIVRIQDTADTGDDAVVFVDGEDATFKRIVRKPTGIMLQPLNSAYEPLYFSNKEIEELPVRVLGIVVEVRRKVKR